MFLILALFPFASSNGLPNQLKNVKVTSWHDSDNVSVNWLCFESNVTSFNIHVLSQPDGTMRNISFTPDYRFFVRSHFQVHDYMINGLEENGTYVITVSAVNHQGEGPASPPLYYTNYVFKGSAYPIEPQDLRKIWYTSRNRVSITWEPVLDSVVRYVVHYTNSSVWKTVETKTPSVFLDDLDDKNFKFNIEAIADDAEEEITKSFPVFADGEDRTGLPQPVIVVEPAHRMFFPGDRMTIKCTFPPNIVTKDIEILLTVGKLSARRGRETWAILDTTADEFIDTAECTFSYETRFETIMKSASKIWKVHQVTNKEYLKRRNEETMEDQKWMRLRNIRKYTG